MSKLKYEQFHQKASLQKRLIKRTNFTYYYLIKKINSVLHDNKNKKVLDIGCGTGAISLYLAKQGCDVTGVDISHYAIELAKKNARNFNLTKKAKFLEKDIQKASIKGNFNLIICSEVLEHLKKDKKKLLDLNKILNKDGKLIISVPSKNAPLFRMGLLQKFDMEVGHLRRYSRMELTKLLEKTGYKILQIDKTESILRNALFTFKPGGPFIKFIRGPISYLFIQLDKLLVFLFGESQIFIIASKK